MSEPSKPKSSKHQSSKKQIIKPKLKATRKSQRNKSGSSSKPTVDHVNLCSDEEKEEDFDEEKEEDSEGVNEEDSEQTILEMIRSARATSKKGKKVATSSLSEHKPPSRQDDAEIVEEKAKQNVEEEV